ncbi:MAG: molybdopterin-dependent oxidoreductase [Nannocystales bacterium]
MTGTRRNFMKGAAVAAAASASRDALAVLPTEELANPPEGLEWNKAPCRFCGTGCHVEVGVAEGEVVAVRGDKQAEVNKGLLCVKGYHVGLALYGADRLRQPLLRKNGKLVPISWDEAIDVIADRVEKGPDGFGFYGSGQWTIPEGYAAQKFIKGGLANNQIDPNARLCMASAVTGFLAVYGVDEPAGCYDDLDVCDVLILWGNNPAEMHPILFSRVLARQEKGEDVRIIDIGTRRTRSTDFADDYLAMKPQGDMAIANGIAHLLLERGSYDSKFVEDHCAFRADSDPPSLHGKPITFEEYREGLAEYTPQRVEELSGVPAAQVEMLADLFGDPKLRITSLWCMGMNQHTQGTAVNSMVHGVHLLSGHFGKPGDAPTSLTGQPSACGTVREVGTLAHALPGGRVVKNDAHREQTEKIWNLPPGRVNPKPGLHTVAMWESFSKEGGDIHTIWVQVTNPAQTLPNRGALVAPSRKREDAFLIVSDVYPTATTEIADLVLPSAMWVEKNGMVGNSERRTQQWFKMVQPPGEARDDCWQTIAVARRLYDRGRPEMKDRDGKFLFRMEDEAGKEVQVWNFDRYYDINVDEQLFEEYRKFSRLKHKDLAPYSEYVKARGMRWPVVQQDDGSWKETRFRFAEGYDPYVEEGKGVDFYHSTTKDGRAQLWLRPYVAPPEVPDAEYPLWLCTGRVLEHWHSGTMTMRMRPCRRAMPSAYVELNPEDAAELGVQDGQKVVVETRRGQLELTAWIDGRGAPQRGNIFIPFFDERLQVNNLTLQAYDPFSKQPDYKKCAARVRRA